MVNNVNAQNYINEKYPTSGTCQRDNDPENKGKTRKGITLLDIRKGKVGNGIFSKNKNLIEDLKLEGFTNLRKLIISSHQITSLDISDCPNLEELDCRGNELTYLKVDGCSNLRKIDCSNNPLRELDLSTCSKLEEANINGCPSKLTEEGATKSNLTYDAEKGKLAKGSAKNSPQITKAKEDDIRNILIVGMTGGGKSTLANVLSNTNTFVENSSSTSVTKNFQTSDIFEWQGKKYRIIDNIGFGDTANISNEDILFKIGEGIHATKEGINQILFVFKGRFSEEQITAFNMFKNFIADTGITKFTTLVRTNFENFEDSQKCQEDRQSLLTQTSQTVREIISSCNNVIYVDNPPIPVIKEKDNERIRAKKEDKIKEISKVNEYNKKKEEIEKSNISVSEKEKEIKKIESETAKEINEGIKVSVGVEVPGLPVGLNAVASVSGTKEIQKEEFIENDINYAVIDTVGIGDTKLKKEEVLDKIAEAVYLAREGVSQILFVTDGRFDQYEMVTFNLLRTIIFDEHVTKHTTIVRTRFEDFEDEEECQADIEKMLTEKELSEIVNSCQGRIVHVNNSSLSSKYGREEREESRKRILDNLRNSCQKNPYKPSKLQELSNEIATDYFDYLKKKQELKEELEKLKLKEETNKESVTKEEESKDCVNVVIGIGERITQLEEKKEKLKKEIQEKEKIIRQKVLKHIFNNYYEINNILGGDFFISSIIGDDNDWRDINEEFVDKAVILKWLSRDDKKLTVEKIQELSHDVKQLKGNGKSTLANVLTNRGELKRKKVTKEFEEKNNKCHKWPYFFHEKCFNFKESCGTTSETRSFQAEEFTYEGENYRIVDTVGIGDTKLSEREVLFKMAEGIYLVKEGIKQVLFVVGNKFTSQEIEIFRLLKDVILESGITEYTTIVKTKFPNFEDHEDCEEDRQTLQEENQAISKILEKSEIIYVDNPPLKGNSETIEANKKTRKSSQGVLFKHLKNNCQEEVKDAKDGVIQKVGTELEHAIEVSEVFIGPVAPELECGFIL
ncbi:789_t:CDS:2 [Entrophospora sp. SA101]|nr:789_t:CDS:2 [Entrophospora sp. SA101]